MSDVGVDLRRQELYYIQGCQITAFLRPNLQQCSLFFFVLAFCFLCSLDYTNDDLPQKCSDLATLIILQVMRYSSPPPVQKLINQY